MGRFRGGAEPCGRQQDACQPRGGFRHPLPRTTPGYPPPPKPCRPSPLLQVVPGQHMASRRQRLRRLRQERQSGAPPPRAAPPQNSSGPQSSSSAQGKGWGGQREGGGGQRGRHPPIPGVCVCVSIPGVGVSSSPIPGASPLLPAGWRPAAACCCRRRGRRGRRWPRPPPPEGVP